MIIFCKQPDGTVVEHQFSPADVDETEAELIEDHGGIKWETFEEFGQMFLRGSSRAHRAALWICLRRKNDQLKFTDVRFRVGDLHIRLTKDEADAYRNSIENDPELDQEQRDFLTAAIKLADTPPPEVERTAARTLPKDHLPSSRPRGSTSQRPGSRTAAKKSGAGRSVKSTRPSTGSNSTGTGDG